MALRMVGGHPQPIAAATAVVHGLGVAVTGGVAWAGAAGFRTGLTARRRVLCRVGAVLAVAAFVSVAPGAAFAAGTAGTISTVAGDPVGSGPALETAQVPAAIAVASGGTSLYVADSSVNAVREVGPSGQETVVAGDGLDGLSGGDGPATNAELEAPAAVAVDPSGDLLIGEFEYVQLVAAESCSSDCPYGLHTMTQGSIYPIAGDGQGDLFGGAQAGDGGPATAVAVAPEALAVDAAGNVLIGEGSQVQLVAAADCSSDCPYGLAAMTAGDIYPVAGSGTYGNSGAGGPATAADLEQLGGIALDSAGDLLIADAGANEVQLVAVANCSSSCPYGLAATVAGDIYAVAGNGTAGESGDGGPATAAELRGPEAVTVNDSGDLLIADTQNARVQLVDSAGVISTVAAGGDSVADGEPALDGGLDLPNALAVDSAGDLLIGDSGNDLVRLVASQACLTDCAFGQPELSQGSIYSIAGDGASLFSGDGGPATEAELHTPEDVAVDAVGDLAISDSYNNRVRWIAAQDCSSACPFGLASTTAGAIYTIAGGGTALFPDTAVPATSVALSEPGGVLFDSAGDVLLSNTGYDLVQVVAARSCSSACPYGLSVMTAGDVYALAGDSGSVYSGDGGPALKAGMAFPEGLALDSEGDVLIADDLNDRIRLVASKDCSSGCQYGLSAMTEGDIYTIAGGGSEGSSATGYPATDAALSSPRGIAVDASGNLVVGDEGDDLVRVIAAQSCSASCPYGIGTLTRGDIYTIAGDGSSGFSGDGGPATSAGLFYPTWVAVDSAGDVLVTDSVHLRVRLIAASNCASNCVDGLSSTTAGDIYTIAGDGSFGFSGDGGPAVDAAFDWEGGGGGLALDGAGNVLIADSGNDRIRRIGASAQPSVTASPSPVPFGDETAGDTSPAQRVTVTNSGGSPLAISAVELTGADAGDYTVTGDSCSGQSIGAGAACAVTVAFAPASVGSYSASLSISDNAAGSPQAVTLTGTGVAPTPTLTPTTLSFGDGSRAAQTVTVTDPGPSTLSIGTPTLSGAQQTAFQIESDECASANLASGHSCKISLTTTATSGTSSATLQIPDNAADPLATVALQAVSPPVFTAAGPPLDVAVGVALDYTFAAQPASAYALAAGAPQWLAINPTSGELSGTVPAGTTSFSYSVTATDAAGLATAGPFFVSTNPVTVTGTVTEPGPPVEGVGGVVVDACLVSGGLCYTATTTSSGSFTIDALAGTSMVFTAYPLPPRASSATDPISIPSTGLSGVSLVVAEVDKLEGVELAPIYPYEAPLLVDVDPTPASVTGCANGLATVTTIGRSVFGDEYTSDVTVLPQTSPGIYSGELPPQFPIHGPAEITSAVDCPPPASALVPSVGPANGGTTVTLTGSGFTGTTGVDFGSTPASSFTVLSDDAIQAVAPAGTGTVAVTVFGGSAPSGGTVVDQYTYQSVDSVAPSSGPAAGGTWVIVDGNGLSSATEVMFGQTAAPSFYVLSDTELEALSPPGTGTQDITVQTRFGGTTPASAADQFTYSSGANAALAKRNARVAEHDAGPPATGAAVTYKPVTAAMARSITTVIDRRLRGQPLEFRLNTPAAPAVAGVVRPDGIPPGGGLAAIAMQFVYQYAPQIYSKVNAIEDTADLAIAEAYPTCETNQNALAAAIDLALTPYVDGLVDALLPEVLAAETASLFETGPALLVLYAVTPLALNYVVNNIVSHLISAAIHAALPECKKPPPPPKPPPPGGGGGGGGFSPNVYIDPGGNVLDTNGNPISGATVTILRSDVWAGPFTALDPSEPGILPAVNPETTGSDGAFDWEVYSGYYDIQATAANCTSAADPGDDTATIGPYPVPPPQLGLVVTMACANEAPAPQPAVDSISTTGGPAAGGTPVTILGTGFTPASTVTFGSVPATDVTYESPQTLTAVSPAGSGMADVVVKTAGGSSDISTADEFYYGSPPTVTGLNVTQGPEAGGTVVTVQGTGFTGATVVGFGGIPGSALDVESDTQLQVTTPAEQPSTVDVVVDTPAGGSTVSSADRFTFLGSTSTRSTSTTSTSTTSTSTGSTSTETSVTTTSGKAPVSPSCTLKPLSNTVLLAKPKPKKGHKSNASVGTLSLTATCNQAVSVRLTGVLTELVGKKPKHGKQKTKSFDLGPVSSALAAGAGKTLVLKLPNGAISGLESKAKESATLTLIATNANGQGRASASITSLRDVP